MNQSEAVAIRILAGISSERTSSEKRQAIFRSGDLENVTANWHKTLGLFARGEYSIAILRAATTLELAPLCANIETKLVLGNPTKSVDRTLLRNIANALSWLDRIKAGKTYEEIATENAIPTDRVRKAIRYAFLAPDIVRAIVEGRQPVGLTSSYLLHHPLPDDWEKQRVLVKTL